MKRKEWKTKMKTTLYLVRHCQAMGNRNRCFQGLTDTQISEDGQKQLDLLSVRLRNTIFDAAYSSPLLRARLTAEAMVRFHPVPVRILPGLVEINAGEWEGQSWETIPDHWPREARDWNERPWDCCPPGGEPMRQVFARMQAALVQIARENPGKTVAVASHGCAIRNAVCWAMGKPIEEIGDFDFADNTGITRLEIDENGAPTLLCFNDISHLPEEMIQRRHRPYFALPEVDA